MYTIEESSSIITPPVHITQTPQLSIFCPICFTYSFFCLFLFFFTGLFQNTFQVSPVTHMYFSVNL